MTTKKIQIFLFLFFFISASLVAQHKESRKVDNFTKITLQGSHSLIIKQGNTNSISLSGDPDACRNVATNVKGSTLVISQKEKKLGFNKKSVTLYVTLKELEELALRGSGKIKNDGPLKTSRMKVSLAGSGKVTLSNLDIANELRTSLNGSGSLAINGSCESLNSSLSGSGAAKIKSKVSEKSHVQLAGSGKIALSGSSKQSSISISGSGNIYGEDFEVKNCSVRIAGSGNISIAVSEKLTGSIAGSGKVLYKGNPSENDISLRGSGSVKKIK